MLESTIEMGLARTRAGAAPPVKETDPNEVTLPPQLPFLRRMWTHHRLSHYRRLVYLVVAVNLALLVYGLTSGSWWTGDGTGMGAVLGTLSLTVLSNMVIGNIALAILIRQQYVINLLFWLATRAPTSWPLRIRHTLGKVYHFGGLHMGGALAGTAWFAILLGAMTYHRVTGLPGVSTGTVAVSYAILGLLLTMVIMALPWIRARHHNSFELTHRLGGWTALALFWLQTVLFINDGRVSGDVSLAEALLAAPSVWLLLLITVSIALPWLRLRRVPVAIETPSSHVALARFDYGVTPMAGSSTAISRSPLREWHSFANVPAPGQPGFRLTISRAGDWTGAFIDDRPSHVWVKGIPTAGVANIEVLFKRVVYVATGSGIGPCLPHLLAQEVPARLVWSTRSPRQTYGDALVDEILAVQPDALIWDTNTHGRPDLVQLAYAAAQRFDAEAVICISNQKLTRRVVYGMESRGIPAYGAIWDS